jgi:hypothetical protein
MKPTAWYDPSNGVVSTDRDCPAFTPLGQVWPLSLGREWVGLTDEEKGFCAAPTYVETVARIEAKLKEKNT